jgi:hypothetical protein
VRRIAVIAAGVAAFLAISAGLARVLSAANAERDAATDAVKAGARSGQVRVLRVDQPARFALGSRTSSIRVVWRSGKRLPVVQCVRVRRSGDLLAGFDVRVLAVSAPIERERSC